MPRLIDADALLDTLKFLANRNHSIKLTTSYYNAYKECMEFVKCAPTVDSEPVRHGRWQKKRNPVWYQVVPYVFVCDQCGTAFECETPYCGECGAKMDEGEENE